MQTSQRFLQSMLHFLFGTRVHVSGDRIETDRPAIIIMNHRCDGFFTFLDTFLYRTRLDWMFLWSALYKIDPWLLTTEKIILKRDLKKLIGASESTFGCSRKFFYVDWAMETANFIFLERKWDVDKKIFDDTVDYYVSTGNNYQIL